MMRSDYDESKEGARIVPQAISAAVLLLAAMFLAFLVSSRAFAEPVAETAGCTDRYAAQAGACVPADALKGHGRSDVLR
jgi:hypothetical protein